MSNAKLRLDRLEKQQPETVVDVVVDFGKPEDERITFHKRQRRPGENPHQPEVAIDGAVCQNQKNN